MEIPLQIAFRNMKRSEAIVSQIKKRSAWLGHFFNRILSCRVVIEIPHKHHQTGNLFQVRIILKVPGEVLVINRNSDLHEAHKELSVALHDAFDKAYRELERYIDKRRNRGKSIDVPLPSQALNQDQESESETSPLDLLQNLAYYRA